MQDRIREMMRLGMRPERRALLVVMRWPTPFMEGFWAELAPPRRVEARTLYEVLAEPERLRAADRLGVTHELLADAVYARPGGD